LTALLSRLFITDYAIGASLPAVLSYRRKAADFSPTDSWEKIAAILGEDDLLPPALFDDELSATDSVYSFLSDIQDEWRRRLFFSDSPDPTEEIIEKLEKEKAEREAQREAK
jgi:hypothetical protein